MGEELVLAAHSPEHLSPSPKRVRDIVGHLRGLLSVTGPSAPFGFSIAEGHDEWAIQHQTKIIVFAWWLQNAMSENLIEDDGELKVSLCGWNPYSDAGIALMRLYQTYHTVFTRWGLPPMQIGVAARYGPDVGGRAIAPDFPGEEVHTEVRVGFPLDLTHHEHGGLKWCADALVDALGQLGVSEARDESPQEECDRFCYERRIKRDGWKAILAAVNRAEKWGIYTSENGVKSCANRHAERIGKPGFRKVKPGSSPKPKIGRS